MSINLKMFAINSRNRAIKCQSVSINYEVKAIKCATAYSKEEPTVLKYKKITCSKEKKNEQLSMEQQIDPQVDEETSMTDVIGKRIMLDCKLSREWTHLAEGIEAFSKTSYQEVFA